MILHNIPIEIPVFEFDISDSLDFAKLRESVLEYKANFKNSRSSSIHAWHSGFHTHLKTPAFNELIQVIEAKATEMVDHFNDSIGSPVTLNVVEAWVAHYQLFNFTEEHNHHQFCYSAVCYISANDCAPIKFGQVEVPVQTGKLLFFPGFLDHSVPPKKPSHGERIVFACNLYPSFDFSNLDKLALINISDPQQS